MKTKLNREMFSVAILWRLLGIAALLSLSLILLRQGYLGGDGWLQAYYGELNTVFGVDFLADTCTVTSSAVLSWVACSFRPVLLGIGFIWVSGVILLVFWR